MPNHPILAAPLTIADQGSFYAGGTRISDGAGNTTFTGHAYVSYQKPLHPRALPMVMWHGGDAEILHLPDAGLKGNSHFPFADRNNRQVAALMAAWLHRKGLDV